MVQTTKENPNISPESKHFDKLDTSEYGKISLNQSKDASKDKNVDQDIENLNQTYDFDSKQKEEIDNFLRENQEIIEVLQEAKSRIKQYFQDENLYLEYEDGEEYEDGGELSLSIETKKDVDEALEKLSDFENNWWTDKWIQINSKLSIDVRFIKQV
ncbi:MAG: hypothetical protein RLZZ74_568 [Cyanobacteriota bacterium]|jgi:hypothetical protein